MDEEKYLLDSLRQIVEQLHIVWIEKEACANLAIAKGATFGEVEVAKRNALNDPEVQEQTKEQFEGMWAVMETAALALLHAEKLQSLPPTDKPN